ADQRRVKHGVQYIHERDVADYRVKKVRAQIGDRTHQQSACAAAFDDQLLVICVARGDEMFGAGDEISESVTFVVQAGSIVPGLAKFAAAPNVRDCVDDTAIEQAQAIRTEVHRNRDSIAAI